MDSHKKILMNKADYITEEDIKIIITNSGYDSDETIIEEYAMQYASDKMIGFLAEYLKLQVYITTNGERRVLYFFVKATPKKNVGKATMVKRMRSFEKEQHFYNVIKRNIEVPGSKPWSARFVASLRNATTVFEDLSALRYEMRSRHNRFDEQHTLQALQALARFHACTIIFEEIKTKELQRQYRLNQFAKNMGKGGYVETDSWFIQCRTGALEAVKTFSKYSQNKDLMRIIETRWSAVFNSALTLSDLSLEHRNVACHRDLWNNNILFHYNKSLEDNIIEPDDCVFVDFSLVFYMPPAGDVMQLLHCNLSSQFRKENLNKFLNYYYDYLDTILRDNNMCVHEIIPRDKFMTSAKEQNLWGLVSHACLVQTFWVNDDKMTEMFEDAVQFNEIMMKDKANFIKNMITNDDDYKKVVLEVFEEIIECYLLKEDLLIQNITV